MRILWIYDPDGPYDTVIERDETEKPVRVLINTATTLGQTLREMTLAQRCAVEELLYEVVGD